MPNSHAGPKNVGCFYQHLANFMTVWKLKSYKNFCICDKIERFYSENIVSHAYSQTSQKLEKKHFYLHQAGTKGVSKTIKICPPPQMCHFWGSIQVSNFIFKTSIEVCWKLEGKAVLTSSAGRFWDKNLRRHKVGKIITCVAPLIFVPGMACRAC